VVDDGMLAMEAEAVAVSGQVRIFYDDPRTPW